MSELNWTSSKPVRPGWYWHRAAKGDLPQPVKITGNEEPSSLSGQWAGPFARPPQED